MGVVWKMHRAENGLNSEVVLGLNTKPGCALWPGLAHLYENEGDSAAPQALPLLSSVTLILRAGRGVCLIVFL